MVKAELRETKGSFKVIGKVSRIDRDGAFSEKVMEKENNKNFGRTYRTIRFGVKTSPTNEITVGSFDYEPTEVFMWNSDKKKADSSYKGDRFPFGVWEERQDELRKEGYAVLQSRIGLTYGEDGKLETKGLPRYVASQEIYEGLNNGDSVVVEGTIRYSEYKEKIQKNYTIERVFKLKNDIDFEDEKFEEVTYFEQEMVYIDTDIDKKEGKAYVTGRIIDFTKNYEDSQFIINFKDDEGNNDEAMVKMTDAFSKKMKFGDVINVFGDTLNRVVLREESDDGQVSEEDALLAMLGGKSKPKHAEGYSAKDYINEMQIHGVDAWDKGVYTEEDFVKKGGLIDNSSSTSNDLSDELGGKKKKKNPFTDDGDDTGSIDEDDLPF